MSKVKLKHKRHINDIFVMDNEGVIDFNMPELKVIEPFKTLIERDAGSVPGDTDGRKKGQAQRDCLFIFLIAHPKSPWFNNDKECIKRSEVDKFKVKRRGTSTVSKGAKWTRDKVITGCIDAYKSAIDSNPSLKFLRSLIEAINNNTKYIDNINVISTYLIGKVEGMISDMKDNEETFDMDDLKECMDMLDTISKNTDKIFRSAKEAPKQIETLLELEKKIVEDMTESGELYGSRAKAYREDP